MARCSSSDGQRFVVGVQTPVARFQRRYFVNKGATIYSWTSDQHTQYGSKIIPATARVAGSLRHGWTPASLLVAKLQSGAPRNPITKAIQEYGRIAKTLSLLRYLHDDAHRRRIHRQLNKGESIHALRKEIFYANRGEIHKRHKHEQDTQTLCLNLLTNVVIAWNTIYIGRIQQHLANQGLPLPDGAIEHTSPTIRAHLNVYGRYDLHRIKIPKIGQFRPLRNT